MKNPSGKKKKSDKLRTCPRCQTPMKTKVSLETVNLKGKEKQEGTTISYCPECNYE